MPPVRSEGPKSSCGKVAGPARADRTPQGRMGTDAAGRPGSRPIRQYPRSTSPGHMFEGCSLRHTAPTTALRPTACSGDAVGNGSRARASRESPQPLERRNVGPVRRLCEAGPDLERTIAAPDLGGATAGVPAPIASVTEHEATAPWGD